jgi:hypothetical protein
MYTAQVIVAALLAAPTSTPTAEFDVSDTEVTFGAESMHVAAFDAVGEQSGEVVIWSDGDSPIRLDANFADGLYVVLRVDGDGHIVEIESPDPGEAVRRMATIGDVAALHDPDATKGEAMCYAGLIGAAAGIFTGNIPTVMVAGFIISCNCLPIVNGTPTPGCD